MLLDVMDVDFKEELKKDLTIELEKKYIRTKQYKEIKQQFDIDADSVVKSGLKDIISELIDKELKRKFK